MSDDKIISGLEEAVAHARGEDTGAVEHQVHVPMYAISGVALAEIADALAAGINGIQGHNEDDSGLDQINKASGFVRAALEDGPIPHYDAPDEAPAAALERLQRELNIASQQRDFLVAQVDSLLQRLGGALMAAGWLDLPSVSGFGQKEVLPINAVLAQIAEAHAPKAEPGA